MSKVKFYPNLMEQGEGENAYQAMAAGRHWIYADVTCPHCGKEQPVAAAGGPDGICCACGRFFEETDE